MVWEKSNGGVGERTKEEGGKERERKKRSNLIEKKERKRK